MTPILGEATLPVEVAEAWAASRGATDEFVALAVLFWTYAPERGVRPEVAYAQAAKETGFGRFGGVIDETFHNTCGLKTTAGGDNGDPNAHQAFPSWDAGVIAHVDHLALYAGAPGYPRSVVWRHSGGSRVGVQTCATPDPRHFPELFHDAPFCEDLSGKWAGSTYGQSLVRDYLEPLLRFVIPEPEEPAPSPVDELRTDLLTWLVSSQDIVEQLIAQQPSRELSLVKTKLDEAELWLGADSVNNTGGTA